MTAKLIDGNLLSASLREQLAQSAAALAARGLVPCLALILAGEDPASAVYADNKVRACEQAGVRSLKNIFPVDVQPATVLARIAELNADPTVHGILVQLPLPRQFDVAAVLDAIDVEKDVDCIRARNLGALMLGKPRFIPCAQYAVMEMLESEKVNLKGAEVVIVGRSNIVGKPMAVLMLSASATVTVCHSQTRDLAIHTRRADVLVAAVGRARMITGEMIKPGATVIDVGLNRGEDGKLCGDVDFASAREIAGLITPVPGGVGPMTITMILANTIAAAERAAAFSAAPASTPVP